MRGSTRRFKGKEKGKLARAESSIISAKASPVYDAHPSSSIQPSDSSSHDNGAPPPLSPVSLSRTSGASILKSEEFKTPEETLADSQEGGIINGSLSHIPNEPSIPSSSALPASDNELQNEERSSTSMSRVSFATPPRVSRSTVFHTPPRPADLPDLPDVPDGSIPSPTTTWTSSSEPLAHQLSMMRTPHPPGSWKTPEPDRAGQIFPPRQDSSVSGPISSAREMKEAHLEAWSEPRGPLPSTPDSVLVISSSEGDEETVGILASISKTPKPPGAWVGTPAASAQSSLRKGILKVRFDEASLNSSAPLERQVAEEKVPAPPSSKQRKGIASAFGGHSDSEEDASNSTSKGKEKTSGGDSPSRRRRARMKMVDAFGNELPSSPEILPAPGEEDITPATEEEIRQLRSIARQVPVIAREFNDDRFALFMRNLL